MTIEIGGRRYYSASEVCQQVDISRPTLFRWLKKGVLHQLHRDRRGWRMFTEEDLGRLRLEAGRVEVQEIP